jgi:aminopeptidase N
MEHQTIIAYGHDFTDGGLGYDAGFDALHLHELAHEWYGNALTASDWKDFWIHEGFATYVEALYAERLSGRAGYDAVIRHFRRQVTHRAPIARRPPTTAREVYSRDIYFKGALVLHTLRGLLGEAPFRAFLRRLTYPDGPEATPGCPCRPVATADVVAAAEAVAGRALGWFFDAYLYHAAPPRLVTVRTSDTLALRWETPAGAPFPLPVEVAVDGEVTRLTMEDGTGAVTLPTPDAKVRLDPDGWLLRRGRSE